MASVDNAKAGSNELFESSSVPGSSAGAIFTVVLAAIFVFGGFYVMALAFDVPGDVGFWLFSASLLMEVIGFWIAFRGDRASKKA